MIKEIIDKDEKEKIASCVLNNLCEWFEVEDARLNYITGSREEIFIADIDKDNNGNDYITGFLTLKENSKYTLEISVMGVLKDYHRKRVGTRLMLFAKEYAKNNGYEFLEVKTVMMGRYSEYDITNMFYKSNGFKELEVIKEIWDEDNPCQIYVMYVK